MIDYIYIETTNYCNLSCSFCNRDEVIGPLKHMTVDDFKRVLDSIKTHPVKEAKLMGMGEPFLHPQFDEICAVFKQYFPGAKLISATNCQYTPGPVFQRALKYIDLLYLSIDGYEDSYEQFRAPSKWSKLIKFLNILKDMDKIDCQLAINYVINPGNVKDIQPVYDHIYTPYAIDEFRLNVAQSWSPEDSIPIDYTREQLDYLRETWKSYIKGKAPWEYKDCFWVDKGLYVTVEGRVLMCCMNTAEKGFGNMLQQPLNLIRTSKRFIEVVNGCKNNTPTDHCKSCSYKELVPVLTTLGINNET